MNLHSPYSYHKSYVDYLISLTDSFTWEDLPIRDPDTGYLTKAGYIPIIQRLTKYTVGIITLFHSTQSTVRIVTSRDMILTSWFPFDTSSTPVYIFANITQVNSLYIGLYMSIYKTIVKIIWKSKKQPVTIRSLPKCLRHFNVGYKIQLKCYFSMHTYLSRISVFPFSRFVCGCLSIKL